MTIARKHPRFVPFDHDLRAVSIMFDFMNPVLARWRLIDRRSKLWLNESEAGGNAKHCAARL